MAARIVIIDDNKDILELFLDILRIEGYEVHLRELIFEDLADVVQLAPHLIILDLLLGSQGEGWEFLQKLKSHPLTASIPLILCTAAQLTPEQQSYVQQLDIPILFKPFDLDELHKLMHHRVGS